MGATEAAQSLIKTENVLIIGAALLFICVAASKISSVAGIPALLIFLTVGIIASKLNFFVTKPTLSTIRITQLLGIITLTFILFAGGLETDFEHIRPILASGILLSTLGTLCTTLIVGYAIKVITCDFGLVGPYLRFNLIQGCLIGAIVASTDAAAVFSILRAQGIRLRADLGPLLELESGSNDVMVYFLMNVCMTLMTESTGYTYMDAMTTFLREMSIGSIGGFLAGKIMAIVINKINLSYEALYPALTISMVILVYTLITRIHGSGFLGVYMAGIVLGNHDLIHKGSIARFYDGIGWLMQIIMFIALGLLVQPDHLYKILYLGILLSLILVFVARPLGVWLSLHLSRFNARHKAFISWGGLRGAVPIIFATYPLTHGIEQANTLFHLIFFIVLISVLLQGTTLKNLAQWLHLEAASTEQGMEAHLQLSEAVRNVLIEVEIPEDSTASGKQVFELGFPESASIVLIGRASRYLLPEGGTQLKCGDKLIIMMNDKRDIKAIKTLLDID